MQISFPREERHNIQDRAGGDKREYLQCFGVSRTRRVDRNTSEREFKGKKKRRLVCMAPTLASRQWGAPVVFLVGMF